MVAVSWRYVMLEWINRLFNQYKFVRRLIIFWALFLVSIVTYRVFWFTEGELTNEYLAVVGLVATAIALYKWSREREDK
jgi:hypothetical protein